MKASPPLHLLLWPLFFYASFGEKQPLPGSEAHFGSRNCIRQWYPGIWKKYQCELGNDFCYVANNCDGIDEPSEKQDHRGCTHFAPPEKGTPNGTANATCSLLGLSHVCTKCRICSENYCNGAVGFGNGTHLLALAIALGTALHGMIGKRLLI